MSVESGDRVLPASQAFRTHIVILPGCVAAGVAATTLLTFALHNPPVHRMLPSVCPVPRAIPVSSIQFHPSLPSHHRRNAPFDLAWRGTKEWRGIQSLRAARAAPAASGRIVHIDCLASLGLRIPEFLANGYDGRI